MSQRKIDKYLSEYAFSQTLFQCYIGLNLIFIPIFLWNLNLLFFLLGVGFLGMTILFGDEFYQELKENRHKRKEFRLIFMIDFLINLVSGLFAPALFIFKVIPFIWLICSGLAYETLKIQKDEKTKIKTGVKLNLPPFNGYL